MKKFTHIIKTLLLLVIINIPVLLMAQDVDPNAPDFPNDVQDAPIDGGVSLLIAAGIAYGAKKAHESRKKNKAVEEQK